MREYTIELFWRCQNDKTLNRGLAAYCSECGKPKRATDEEVWPDDLSESNAIRDLEQLRLANGGPDWSCKFCDTLQNSTGQFCIHCGADRKSGARPWKAMDTTVTEDLRTGRKTKSTREATVAPRIYPQERRSLGPWSIQPTGSEPDEYETIRQTDTGAVGSRVWKEGHGRWAFEVNDRSGVRRTPKEAKDAADTEAHVQGWALRNQNEIEIPPEVKPDSPVDPPSPTAGYRSAPAHARRQAKSSLDMAIDDIEVEKTTRRLRGSKKTGAGTIVLVVAPLIALLMWALFHERTVDAEVSALQWKRITMVERKSVYPFEGYSPADGAFEIHEMGQRIHHYDHVRVGSHREPYPESYSCGETCTTTPRVCTSIPRSCTSNKNGTARCSGGGERCSGGNRSCATKWCTRTAYRTVDDYEDQPRYRMYYGWKAWTWKHSRDIPLAGSDNNPRWPTEDELRPRDILQPGEEERTSNHEVLFKVTFAADKDTFAHEPETEISFRGFTIGSRYRLTMSVASGIKTMLPIK